MLILTTYQIKNPFIYFFEPLPSGKKYCLYYYFPHCVSTNNVNHFLIETNNRIIIKLGINHNKLHALGIEGRRSLMQMPQSSDLLAKEANPESWNTCQNASDTVF